MPASSKVTKKIDTSGPVEFRRLTREEHNATIDKSRIIAVFVEAHDALGVMIDGTELITREEKTAFLKAVRNLPTRD